MKLQNLQKLKKLLLFLPNIIASVILLQTLAFKFTADPQSVEIFTKLALLGLPESIFRVSAGIAELIAGIMLLIPKYAHFGAIISIFIMLGALLSHILVLGFAGSNATLAFLAIMALISAILVLTFYNYASSNK